MFYLGSEIVSEFGFSESVQPLVNVASAGAAGFAFGGPAGAAIAVIATTVSTALGEIRRLRSNFDGLNKASQAIKDSLEKRIKQVEEQQKKAEEERQENLELRLYQQRKQLEELEYQSWLNSPFWS